MDKSLYKDILLDHYRHPRNRGDLDDADDIARGSNPRCGDDIEVGVNFEGDTLQQVRFRGRGCSVCIASASMMTEVVTGKTSQQADALYRDMKVWINDGGQEAQPDALLQVLDAVRHHPARKRCVMLAWEALKDVLLRIS